MDKKLTENDFAVLKSFADKGDRYNYWKYLSQFDDGYANLALGVVTNETTPGCIANLHTKISAQNAGKKLSRDDEWLMGEEIMRGDLRAREARFISGEKDGGLNLPVRMIARYHKDALEKIGLGIEAWTANEPLKQPLLEGNDEEAERIWSKMKQGGFLNYLGLGLDNISKPEWVLGAAGKSLSCAITPTLDRSYRSVDRIGSFEHNRSSGDWFIDFPEENIGPRKVDARLQEQLNSERTWRQRKFGDTVIQSDHDNPSIQQTPSYERWEDTPLQSDSLEQRHSFHQNSANNHVPFTPIDDPQRYAEQHDEREIQEHYNLSRLGRQKVSSYVASPFMSWSPNWSSQ